ncbi:MAG: hypothetical protein U1A27_05750 [Phycisphaerae bacterium]
MSDAPTIALTAAPADAPRDVRLAAAIVLAGLAAAIGCGLASDGLHHFDDLTHFLMARWSSRFPRYLLNDWGRPGFTALYALPAQLGWPAARLFSAGLSAVAAWGAFRIAQRLGLARPWLAAMVCWVQPLFFELSLTTLTETALAFYLTAATWLALRGRWSLSAAVLSIGFVTRHEAIVFLPVWVVCAWQCRVPLWRLWPAAWAVACVNGLAHALGQPTAIGRWFAPHPTSQYGHSGWLTFLCRSMEAWGPAGAAAGLAGLAPLWRRAGGGLVAGSVLVYLAAQTAIRALGLFDSGGYPRFLVPVAPLLAVCATAAVGELLARETARRRIAGAAVALAFALLWLAMEIQLGRPETPAYLPQVHAAKWAVRGSAMLFVMLGLAALATAPDGRATRRLTSCMVAALATLGAITAGYLIRPLRVGPGERVVDQAIAWLDDHGLHDRPFESAHVYAEFRRGAICDPRQPPLRDRLAAAPNGTILMWDRQFAASADHGLPLGDVQDHPGWRRLFSGDPLPYQTEPQVRLFEKVGPWP